MRIVIPDDYQDAVQHPLYHAINRVRLRVGEFT